MKIVVSGIGFDVVVDVRSTLDTAAESVNATAAIAKI